MAIVTGNGRSNVFAGTGAADTISGLGGDDILNGGAGNDLLLGGDGSDFLYGEAGNDTLSGDDGIDLLMGGIDDDLLNGGDAGDLLFGGDGADRLNGDAGDDVLSGDVGRDTLVGGAGSDLLSGGDGNDVLSGDEGADTLNGGDDGDLLDGGVGNDWLSGDQGNDTLIASSGNDTFIGGEGADTLVLTGTRRDYSVAQAANGDIRIVDLRSGSPQGSSLVRSTERFVFSDGTLTSAELLTPPAAAPTYSITVGSASVAEGNTGAGNAITYTVSRTGDVSKAGTVAVGFSGTATNGSDYGVTGLGDGGVVRFAAGASSATFTVTTKPDTTVEADETIIATLGQITGGGTLGAAKAATATIANDDIALPPPSYTIAVAPATMAEGNTGAGNAITYTVSRTGDISKVGTVAVGFTGTATNGNDYGVTGLADGGVVRFAAGASSATFTVTTKPDTTVEADETVIATLGAITGGGGLGSNKAATATITNDDAAPTPPTYTIAVSPAAVVEGNTGAGNAITYTVSRTGDVSKVGTVAIGFTGTATNGTDYAVAGLADGGIVRFAAGALSATFTVTTKPDVVVEPDETVVATLGAITGGGILGASKAATATIISDDAAPTPPTYTIAADSAFVAEGSTGAGNAITYTVSRTGDVSQAGTVAIAFTGSATNGSDYAVTGLTDGAVTFAANATTATFTIRTTPDSVLEADETVIATLGAVTGGGQVGSAKAATVTITNDDMAPTYQISVDPSAVAEGDAGAGTAITYTVSRTGDVSKAGTVAVGFTGTADSSDYAVAGLTDGAVSFAVGASSATFTVTTKPDTIVEADETVIATLGTITGGGTLGATAVASAIITNDDSAPTYTIVVAPAAVQEGDIGSGSTITYTVERAGDVSKAGSVAVTLGGTADSDDYTVAGLADGIASFVAGATNATFTVTTKSDTVVEADETVIATLGTITGGGTLAATAASTTATITNDDSAPSYTIAVAPTSVAEGDAGSGNTITYTVTRTGDVSGAGTVAVALSGNATLNSDYTTSLQNGIVAFTAGAVRASFTVTTTPDTVLEGDETVTATLGDVTGGGQVGSNGTATAIITNDDKAPTYSITVAPASVYEGDTGSGNTITYTVTRTGDVSEAGSVAVGFTGTADSDDYAVAGLTDGAISFAGGATSATFKVTTKPDIVAEADETVVATLSTITGGGTLGNDKTATATLKNDEVSVIYSLESYNDAVTEDSSFGYGYSFGVLVHRTGDVSQYGEVALSFAGTATKGIDYAEYYYNNSYKNGIATFNPGQRDVVLNLETRYDNIYEGDETVVVKLGAVTGGGTADPNSAATITLLDNDPDVPPIYQISFSSSDTINEGDTGSGNTVTYRVFRNGNVSQAGTVAVALSGTADSSDYTVAGLTDGTIGFAPGASSATFTITSKPDTVVEPDETVVATLGAITGGGTVGEAAAATATIYNDDGAAFYSIATEDGAVGEDGFYDGYGFGVLIHRTGDVSQYGEVVLDFSGTATKGTDYGDDNNYSGYRNGIVSFNPGQRDVFASLRTRYDNIYEGDETVVVKLGAVTGGGTADSNSAATITLLDNDPDVPPIYQISFSSSDTVNEGDTGSGNTVTYRVFRNGNVSQAGTVAVALSGTADSSDYTVAGLTDGTIGFAPGASSATFTITSKPDTVVEPDETVVATLGAITGGGTVGEAAAATATIYNDDGAAFYSIATEDGAVGEDGFYDGYGFGVLIHRTGDVSQYGEVVLDFSGTATKGTDYGDDNNYSGYRNGIVSFNPGQRDVFASLRTRYDNIYEGDETVVVTLGTVTGGGTADPTSAATFTIKDNDPDVPPTYQIALLYPDSVTEGSTGGGNTLTYEVSRTGNVSQAGAVAIILGGTATSDDYRISLQSNVVDFIAGSTRSTFTITTTPDILIEPDETVTATLGTIAGGGTIGVNALATGTIYNDDFIYSGGQPQSA
ncbi:Calx-beta domain-containing protein [Methylobacterium sp. A54F]